MAQGGNGDRGDKVVSLEAYRRRKQAEAMTNDGNSGSNGQQGGAGYLPADGTYAGGGYMPAGDFPPPPPGYYRAPPPSAGAPPVPPLLPRFSSLGIGPDGLGGSPTPLDPSAEPGPPRVLSPLPLSGAEAPDLRPWQAPQLEPPPLLPAGPRAEAPAPHGLWALGETTSETTVLLGMSAVLSGVGGLAGLACGGPYGAAAGALAGGAVINIWRAWRLREADRTEALVSVTWAALALGAAGYLAYRARSPSPKRQLGALEAETKAHAERARPAGGSR